MCRIKCEKSITHGFERFEHILIHKQTAWFIVRLERLNMMNIMNALALIHIDESNNKSESLKLWLIWNKINHDEWKKDESKRKEADEMTYKEKNWKWKTQHWLIFRLFSFDIRFDWCCPLQLQNYSSIQIDLLDAFLLWSWKFWKLHGISN